jgi:hypothetical protein
MLDIYFSRTANPQLKATAFSEKHLFFAAGEKQYRYKTLNILWLQ